MATQFPEELDSFTNPQPTDSVAAVSHAAQHANANDAIEALQAKVGVDGSTNTTSLDYRVTALENSPTDTESIQDIVAGVLNAGTHTNITVTYDDDNNKISLAATYGDEQVIDAIATALTAGTGITKEFDDNLNTITISIDTNSIATQQYVTDAINNIVDSAPGLLDTLNELAAAIGDDANFATTINTAIANAITTANTYTDNTINALDTDDIEEGTTNKYFTDQRALDATSAAYDPAGSASAAQTAAQIYADGLAVNYDPAGAAATAESNANTYTDTAIGNLNTDDIEEGTSNLYHTAQRAKDAAAELLTNASTTNISITGTGAGLTITAENGVADSDTDDLTEGTTNLYFTNQRALDATSAAYDSAGSAAQALTDANVYTNSAIQTHNFLTSGVHGVSGDVVGTTDSQTLTNKTMGDDLLMDGNQISGLGIPTQADHAATKAYVDTQDATTLESANDYTDLAIAGLGDTVENGYIPISQKANPGGVASLNVNGKVPSTQLDQEQIQDFVAPLLNHAFHTNISVTYDDDNNRLVLQGNAGGGGGGASVIISPTAPSTPGLGDIWLDSDNGKTYIWDGAFWIEVGGSSSQAIAAVTSTPPSSPILGTIWMNSSTAKTYIYDGSFWAQI